MAKESKGHAIMISIPYQGHITPFTYLALKLATKGFTVTFAHLEFVHHRLCKAHTDTYGTTKFDLFSKARESGLDIRYTTITDGLPLDFDRELHFVEFWETILRDFSGHVDKFLGKMIQSDLTSTYFLVTDTAYPWSSTIADKYGIVNVSFWTQPALVFSTAYHSNLMVERGHIPCPDKFEEIDYIPGVKSINTKDLASYITETDLEDLTYKVLSLAFKKVNKADFILHNTVEEFEPDILSALNQNQPNYAIGPINFSVKNGVTKSLWPELDCTGWLESKPPGSVLYISFGSYVHTSKQIVEEIAYGLLLSGVNFLWVIRDGILDTLNDSVLPAGFENEVKDRGLVVSWCDQIRVLSDPAVGGFLTHSGWNSTIESMWYGVPMISYPIAFDQFTNRKLVVDDWKIGINLCDGRSVDRIVVAERIKSLMSKGSISEGLKAEAGKVKMIMRESLGIDGSSERNFDRFVCDLEAKFHDKAENCSKKI